jgi:hypothetical protein
MFLSSIAFFCLVITSKAWTCPTSSHEWTTRHHRRQQQPSELHLRFIETELTPAKDDAISAAAETLGKEYGVDWFKTAEAWAQAKNDFPMLASYDDAKRRQPYLMQTPKMLDLLLKLPLGPFLLINLVVLATGVCWCDTPFHQDGAQCPLLCILL